MDRTPSPLRAVFKPSILSTGPTQIPELDGYNRIYDNLDVTNTSQKVGRPRTRRGPRGKIADALREARAVHGWAQARAAASLGIPQSVLAGWESGTHRPQGLALRYLLEVWIPRSLDAGKEQDQ